MEAVKDGIIRSGLLTNIYIPITTDPITVEIKECNPSPTVSTDTKINTMKISDVVKIKRLDKLPAPDSLLFKKNSYTTELMPKIKKPKNISSKANFMY